MKKYMAFYSRSLISEKIIDNNAIMTLRASFNEDIFSYLKVYLPEYEQQKSIGDFLYTIEEKIRLNNKVNFELESLAKLVYDYWFVQFEFPNNEGNTYKSSGGKMTWEDGMKCEIPEEWEVKEINQIESNIVTGKNPIDKEFRILWWGYTVYYHS
ncbi:restriction endonuclease subunit S [Peribacillus frigoritolerans]|nr:restriction endonuclease subunit S [Peribacillus frigoritolerans]